MLVLGFRVQNVMAGRKALALTRCLLLIPLSLHLGRLNSRFNLIAGDDQLRVFELRRMSS